MISSFLEDYMISTAITRLETLISLSGATLRIMRSTTLRIMRSVTKHANWRIKENTKNEIRQFVSTILRHTTNNMQRHIQMCMVQTGGHLLQTTWSQYAQDETRYVISLYHILFIHS